MRQRARADNLTVCYLKKQMDVSFSCACPVIDNEFRYNIVKVVCGSTRLSPRGSTVLWQCYDAIHDQKENRRVKNWGQFVKLTTNELQIIFSIETFKQAYLFNDLESQIAVTKVHLVATFGNRAFPGPLFKNTSLPICFSIVQIGILLPSRAMCLLRTHSITGR